MSGSMNKAILIGRLGADPEVRYTPTGIPVANFRIATTEHWTSKDDGQKQSRTQWHRIVAWARTAELCGKYLTKGRQVSVEGSLQTRQWIDRDGNKRYTTEIRARQVVFLDRPAEKASERPTVPVESEQCPPVPTGDIPDDAEAILDKKLEDC